MTTLAERIQYAMEQRNMSQADLARATGISTANIANIVTGKTRDPQFSNVVKIALALDVSLTYLAGNVNYYVVRLDFDED